MISLSPIGGGDLQKSVLPAALFTFEDAGPAGAQALPPGLRKQLFASAQGEGFKGSLGECATVAGGEKGANRRWVLVGLGQKRDYSQETLRRAAGALAGYARNRWGEIAVYAGQDPGAAAEGLLLASYRFQEYKKPEPEKLSTARLVVASPAERQAAEKALAKAGLHAEAVCFARDLVNRAPSDKSPQSLAQVARELHAQNLSVKVIVREQAQELGMGAFLGVARGSTAEPALVHLAYKPKGPVKKRVGLVGKGIAFDSGGLSLKSPQSMETMKMDMAGAASVLSVFKVIGRLKPKAEAHGFCALTYNMPGPDAMKPGDVVRSLNGKTIEVLNTDAEGRLVLADALAYAARENLDALIDLATLTGAVVVALGSKVTGVMANNRALLERLKAAAARTGEALCELPLVRDYKESLKSPVADLQNIGKIRGEAGSIIGGLFLEEFVEGRPWVHLDIAGTAWNDSPSAYCPQGGTGSMVRTLLEYLAGL